MVQVDPLRSYREVAGTLCARIDRWEGGRGVGRDALVVQVEVTRPGPGGAGGGDVSLMAWGSWRWMVVGGGGPWVGKSRWAVVSSLVVLTPYRRLHSLIYVVVLRARPRPVRLATGLDMPSRRATLFYQC
jgi:hypothetical protein